MSNIFLFHRCVFVLLEICLNNEEAMRVLATLSAPMVNISVPHPLQHNLALLNEDTEAGEFSSYVELSRFLHLLLK